MKVTVEGRVLSIRTGTNKNTGKAYTCADLYDGNDLIKVYGVDVASIKVDQQVMIRCRMNVDYAEQRIFFSALTDRDG